MGAPMLNRLTVSALLKAVILSTALAVVLGFSLTAWSSWSRLQSANRIVGAAAASAELFKAMANLRADRSTSSRQLTADTPIDGNIENYLREIRGALMPALARALEILPSLDFPQHQTLVGELGRLNKTLLVEQAEFWTEAVKPKASRRLALAQEYVDTEDGLLTTLDKLSSTLASNVNHQDATIDQLLAIKQVAWLLRNSAGEASLAVGNALGSGRVTPEAEGAYIKLVGGTEAAWKALELAVSGMQLPPALSTAMSETKAAYFDPQYTGTRDRIIASVAKGEKAEMTGNQWSPYSVGRMMNAVKVAEAALEATKDHSTAQRSAAMGRPSG